MAEAPPSPPPPPPPVFTRGLLPRLGSLASAWFAAHTETARSPAQLERERHLLPGLPSSGLYHRLHGILPVILAQAVVGSFYSTSVFNKAMDAHVWLRPGANAAMFTTCVAFYGLGTVFFGPWVARNGAFAAVRRSLLLTPVGWALAGLASRTGSLPLLIAGYGILHGLGCAHAYISTTAMLQGWFPDLKGLVSGLAVCGAGIGSVIWTTAARALLAQGHEVYEVQFAFAAIFFAVLLVVLPFMRNAPPGWKPAPPVLPAPDDTSVRARLMRWAYGGTTGKEGDAAGGKGEVSAAGASSSSSSSTVTPPPLARCRGPAYSLSADKVYTFGEAARQQEFVLTALMVFGQVISGAVFLSSAADLTANIFGFDASYASLVTSYLNTVNFTGRFLWGFVTDRIGRKSFWLLSSFVQVCALLAMTQAIPSRAFGPWLACFLAVGSLYGGCFGVLPAFLSDLLGPKISAATHGTMIGVWALSVVAGVPVFTAVTSHYSAAVPASPGAATVRVPTPEAYVVNAYWLSVFPALSFLVALWLNVRREDRVLRKSLGGGLLRLPGGLLLWVACRVFSPPQQEAEYARVGARGGWGEVGGEDKASGGGDAAAGAVEVEVEGGREEGKGEAEAEVVAAAADVEERERAWAATGDVPSGRL
jgi:MFS family permease